MGLDYDRGLVVCHHQQFRKKKEIQEQHTSIF